jgi:hypothetical protein
VDDHHAAEVPQRVVITLRMVFSSAMVSPRYVVNIFTVTMPSEASDRSCSGTVSSHSTTHPCSALSHNPCAALARWAAATSAGFSPGRGMAKSTIVVVPPKTAAVVAWR